MRSRIDVHIQVGSHGVTVLGVEDYPQASSAGTTPQTANYVSDNIAIGWHGAPHHQIQSRTSLPMLHTRSSLLDAYDQYENSPVDSYTYASTTIPRQGSFASSYGGVSSYPGIENYRSWSTSSAPMFAPVSTTYYEPHPAYSFGSLQAPSLQPNTTRLPSVTADSFSSLDMGSLHSSLPAHTAQERRLPAPHTAPYTIHYPPQTPYSTTEQLPVLRSWGGVSEPRAHLHGIHSLTAMPWSSESTSAGARTASVSSMAPITGLPGPAALQQSTATPVSEPVLGYQFLPTTGSPEDVSPTSASGPTTLDSYSSTASSSSSAASMPPPSNIRGYSTTHHQHLPALNSIEPSERPMTASSAREATAPNLYSFSTDTGERPATSGSDQASGSTVSSGHNYVPLRQPQPQHAANVETLRRQSSFDQQRAATADRMSVSNLNGRY